MLIKRTNNGLYPSLLNGLFDDGFFTAPVFKYNSNFSAPAVNVKETEAEYELELAAPGLKKDDFKINLDHEVLTISVESKQEHFDKLNDQNANYTLREFSYNSFVKSFSLPENVIEEDKIEANYADGILKIHLPKRENAKPRPAKEIAIS